MRARASMSPGADYRKPLLQPHSHTEALGFSSKPLCKALSKCLLQATFVSDFHCTFAISMLSKSWKELLSRPEKWQTQVFSSGYTRDDLVMKEKLDAIFPRKNYRLCVSGMVSLLAILLMVTVAAGSLGTSG